MEDVRCFAGVHTVPIRPLTLLVGENNTGKTTLLAAASLVFDYGFPMRSDFNRTPFQLGSFDTIAAFKGGRLGRADSFSIGRTGVLDAGVTLRATYRERAGEPIVSAIKIVDASEQAEVSIEVDEDKADLCVRHRGTVEVKESVELPHGVPPDLDYLLWAVASERGKPLAERVVRMVASVTLIFPGIGQRWHRRGPLSAVAMAPIRSKPQRTYSEISSGFRPEGDHVPFLLSKLSGREAADEDGVGNELKAFGGSSGLFEEVTCKRLGKRPSDPFQVLVKATGPPANLVDVGYGVSQVLPILVDSVTAPPGVLVLIQQPEVHLHPRAQAALGSFFVHLAADEGRHLVVETHSDYIIDRVRMDVADGKIAPEDVALLYFEKEHVETTIHRIAIDRLGNLVDAPRTYGDFFLREASALVTGKR